MIRTSAKGVRLGSLRLPVFPDGQRARSLRWVTVLEHEEGDVTVMPRFVIEREIPGAGKFSDAEIREASLKSLEALRQLGPEIQWIQSYVTDDKIYCIYFSPDEITIREHGRLASMPVDRVAAVRRLVDPVNYA